MINITQDYQITDVRRKAEEIVKHKHEVWDQEISDADKLRLYHELEVHQIELELQAEELLMSRSAALEAAQKYTELYEAAPISFFTLDNRGKILELNVFASNLLNQNKEDLINSHFTSFVHPEDRYLFDSFIENVFHNQAQSNCEVRLQTSKSHAPVFVILTGILVKHWCKCLLTALDITEQKKAQEVIIENQRLGAIGEMASSIAHDFNNSLQSLLGNLELEMNGKGDSRHLNTMKTLITDAAARVRQLQRFSGRDSGRNQFSYIDVKALVEEVIAQTKPLWKDEAQAKGICFNIKFDTGPEAGINGNKGELRSALFNVLKNSIEAMPTGGTILIKTRKNDDNVFFTVTDTGLGMDEETRIRIFQPFYSTKDLNRGRGLGMSSVLSIVKEHQGEVWVTSTAPGKGTTIEIKLPVQKQTAYKQAYEDKASTKSERKTLNLLWVDDDADIRLFAEEAIKLTGHNVTMAQSGMEALQLLEKNTYDLVVTDIGMPEMNGWQLADKIIEKYNGDVKLAVVSGWGTQIKESELSAHGVKYLLNKPFKLAQLKELFESLV